MDERHSQSVSPKVLGIVFIVLGVFALLGQLLHFSLGDFIWPFFIIVPGVLIFIYALTACPDRGASFSTLGSILFMVGVLLLYQNTFGHWESWAYAWALIAPTSVGLGQIFFGTLTGRRELVNSGRGLVSVGLTMFFVGFVFFELVLGISGIRFGLLGWSLFLIVCGAFVLFRNVLSGERGG